MPAASGGDAGPSVRSPHGDLVISPTGIPSLTDIGASQISAGAALPPGAAHSAAITATQGPQTAAQASPPAVQPGQPFSSPALPAAQQPQRAARPNLRVVPQAAPPLHSVPQTIAPPAVPPADGPRRVWIKRRGTAQATSLLVDPYDLVDDLKTKILLKYPTTLLRTVDPADLVVLLPETLETRLRQQPSGYRQTTNADNTAATAAASALAGVTRPRSASKGTSLSPGLQAPPVRSSPLASPSLPRTELKSNDSIVPILDRYWPGGMPMAEAFEIDSPGSNSMPFAASGLAGYDAVYPNGGVAGLNAQFSQVMPTPVSGTSEAGQFSKMLRGSVGYPSQPAPPPFFRTQPSQGMTSPSVLSPGMPSPSVFKANSEAQSQSQAPAQATASSSTSQRASTTGSQALSPGQGQTPQPTPQTQSGSNARGSAAAAGAAAAAATSGQSSTQSRPSLASRKSSLNVPRKTSGSNMATTSTSAASASNVLLLPRQLRMADKQSHRQADDSLEDPALDHSHDAGVEATAVNEELQVTLTHMSTSSAFDDQDKKIVPRINVLIVEDNVINQMIMEEFMRRNKVRFATAKNGREAVSKWREGGFHLIFMDLQLPLMTGLEATKEIRRLEFINRIGAFSTSELPTQPPSDEDKLNRAEFKSPIIIVALTAASASEDNKGEALAAGCNDFLTKPVDMSWLNQKIREWGCMQALIDYDGWKQWRKDSDQAEREANTAAAAAAMASGGASTAVPAPATSPKSSNGAPLGSPTIDVNGSPLSAAPLSPSFAAAAPLRPAIRRSRSSTRSTRQRPYPRSTSRTDARAGPLTRIAAKEGLQVHPPVGPS